MIRHIKLSIAGSTDIFDACEKAIQLASQEETIVEFTFNNTVMVVKAEDTANEKVREYHARRNSSA